VPNARKRGVGVNDVGGDGGSLRREARIFYYLISAGKAL
jgi:hypothetical protein